jgi:thioredoxin reductase
VPRTVAILGAGPAGLAAACACLARGFEPLVLERDRPGASLAAMGPTRFFTPLGMNVHPEVLALAGGDRDPTSLCTSGEIAQILQAAAASPRLAGRVRMGHRVVRVARHTFSRGDYAGNPIRRELPFRVVATTPEGERTFEADAVLDASGTYGNPVPLAASGWTSVAARAIRDLGTLHARRRELVGQRVLLVGHGHSAANAVLVLESIARESERTRVVWALRSRNRRPLATAPSDPLPERARIVAQANALAEAPPPWLRVERAAFVESVSTSRGGLEASLSGGRNVEVDTVVALVGYRPDLEPLSELPLEISPATEGSMRLSRALANVTDCLSVPAIAPADLASGEPRFHLIGAKSYGRARTFLLATGYAQIASVVEHLFAEP